MPNCHRPLPSLMTSFFLRCADAAAFRSTDVHGMTCCTGHCAEAGFFNSRVAERDLRRYRRRGPDASTRMLLAELRR